ncbi:MAG: ThiF family adenylyltransferase [Gammaproteobacteria bacterium]|nr:ThiF family adenylyltransferase [Gammaproteobacteria bacterium]
MIWWIFQNSRLSAEKATLTDLEGAVDWLHVAKWHASKDFRMQVDFEIDHCGKKFAFNMIYPSIFPDAPPMIYTADRTRISLHQYGPDGELCLEHRPDNWRPSKTGADMVASCYNLLVEERPDAERTVHAHSAHVRSLGRDLRSSYCRLLIRDADLEILAKLDQCRPEVLSLYERHAGSAVIASIAYLGEKDAPVWTSDFILPKGCTDSSGYVVRIPESGKMGPINIERLTTFLNDKGLCDLVNTLVHAQESMHLLVGDQDNWELFWIHGDAEKREIVSYTTINIPSADDRIPSAFSVLPKKKVGIVGCGSVGSKIAASLCRSGVGQFLLIDDDIFFPDNVVRNELDITDTGAHKSYALKDRLLEINPVGEIRALRLSLGGQESASTMVGALEALADCDLLIDATAESVAFNMLASVSKRRKVPMVWALVFAGGIGGIVARARPNIDPVPNDARGQIDVWCVDRGKDWNRGRDATRYSGERPDGKPMIASDAEVSIIASHATRFAVDILAGAEESNFPASAYVIGFSRDWIFEQPFDTWPINLQCKEQWGETLDPLSEEELSELLKEHLLPIEDADANSSST